MGWLLPFFVILNISELFPHNVMLNEKTWKEIQCRSGKLGQLCSPRGLPRTGCVSWVGKCGLVWSGQVWRWMWCHWHNNNWNHEEMGEILLNKPWVSYAKSHVVFLRQRALCVLLNKPIVMNQGSHYSSHSLKPSEIHESFFFFYKTGIWSNQSFLSPSVAFITMQSAALWNIF